MEKFVIVPKRHYVSEPIEAASPEEALIDFATKMDTDMNLYFMAVPESKANINDDNL